MIKHVEVVVAAAVTAQVISAVAGVGAVAMVMILLNIVMVQ